MKFPSLNNENRFTLKCRLFGCRNEETSCVFYDEGEKHGIKGFSFATATKTLISYTFKGCVWCQNYSMIFGEETEIWPKWLCGCPKCENTNE